MPATHRPLRIVLATAVYGTGYGGAEEWVHEFARWLIARDHRVCAVCERAVSPPPDQCTLLALPEPLSADNCWRRARALQTLVKQYPADIVHDAGCLMASDVFHPLMGSLIHNWYRQLRAYPPAWRWYCLRHRRLWREVRLQLHQLRHHRCLAACSQRVVADFAQLGCRTRTIIPNGIKLPALATETVIRQLRGKLGVGERLLALVTANNLWLKGGNTVLRALTLLDDRVRKQLLVVMAGHNQDKSFEQFIARHNLGDCCRLTGWLENVDEYYQASDIFLHPTYHDAGSLSTLKALAAGCAVVSSRFDGSAEVIHDGIDGLVLERPDDARELAAVIVRLLDAGLRKRLGAAARQLAPTFTQAQNFQRFEELYFNLAAGGTTERKEF